MKLLPILLFLLPLSLLGQQEITIDGNFADWATIPVAVSDPADDVHDTDGAYPDDGQPTYVNYSDVDILEVKFTNDEKNLYGYIKATGQIGRTSSDTLGHGKKGRYYFIFTIDTDNNDTTGYRLKEGGYYPDSRGYDVNMEVEFYDGAYNTGHYINHEFLTEQQLNEEGAADLANGVIDLAPGVYDYYTQWVTFEDSSYVMVEDRGPVYQGIITIAVSPDGHEAEIMAPMWGFLKTPEGIPIVDFGYTMDISASLEGSGELSEQAHDPSGSSSAWGSDTAEPFKYTVINPATAIIANELKPVLPSITILHANYPNPFNPQTTIAYELAESESVRLTVYDILGREVIRLVDQPQAAGHHQVTWNGIDKAGNQVSSGIYLYRLQSGSFSQVQKMILSR
jgi:hypothetical protein